MYKKSQLVGLVAGKALLTASHLSLAGEKCERNSKTQEIETTPVNAVFSSPGKSFVKSKNIYVVGSDISSLNIQIDGIQRCGQLVDVYMVYSTDLSSSTEWPQTQVGRIMVGKNIEIFDTALNVPSQDKLNFTLNLDQVREKLPNQKLLFIQAATFPSGSPINFETAQISNLVNLAIYPKPVCSGEKKTESVVPCF